VNSCLLYMYSKMRLQTRTTEKHDASVAIGIRRRSLPVTPFPFRNPPLPFRHRPALNGYPPLPFRHPPSPPEFSIGPRYARTRWRGQAPAGIQRFFCYKNWVVRRSLSSGRATRGPGGGGRRHRDRRKPEWAEASCCAGRGQRAKRSRVCSAAFHAALRPGHENANHVPRMWCACRRAPDALQHEAIAE